MKISSDRIYQSMGYFPHAVQKSVHQSQARFKIVAAGSRGGKSMLAGAEIAKTLLLPNKRVWCVATQYTLAEKEFDWAIQFLDRFYLDGHRALKLAKISNSQRGSHRISFPWGSWCETKSCEKPQLLLGDELDLVVLCEASTIPASIWERKLRMRLGPRQGKLIATSTPDADGGLFYKFFQSAEKTEGWERWQFETLANPTFSRDEWKLAEKELAKKVFDEQCRGLFVSRKGHVFDLSAGNYTSDTVADDWLIIAGIHYRSNNPTIISLIGFDPASEQRRYVVFDEIYSDNASPLELIPALKEKIRGRRKWSGVIVDLWDGAIQRELKEVGVVSGVNRGEKDLGKSLAYTRRIQGLQNLLKIQEDGKSRLLFNPVKVPHIIEHFQKVKWPERKDEEEESQEQDRPLTKYMFGPVSVSLPVAYLETILGINFYRVSA